MTLTTNTITDSLGHKAAILAYAAICLVTIGVNVLSGSPLAMSILAPILSMALFVVLTSNINRYEQGLLFTMLLLASICMIVLGCYFAPKFAQAETAASLQSGIAILAASSFPAAMMIEVMKSR